MRETWPVYPDFAVTSGPAIRCALSNFGVVDHSTSIFEDLFDRPQMTALSEVTSPEAIPSAICVLASTPVIIEGAAVIPASPPIKRRRLMLVLDVNWLLATETLSLLIRIELCVYVVPVNPL